MVLKIERIAQGRATVLRLSGRIQSEHLDQLKGQIEIIKEHVIAAGQWVSGGAN
jgi:hypothetical protein